MEKKKKFLSLAVAAFAACLIALGAMLCVPAVARAEEASEDLVVVNTEKAAGAFNSIRVTVPVNVNKENEWYGSAGLYFGLADNGGTADLSSFSALKLRVRGVTTTNMTKVRMIVIDENGNARWVKETSSTSGGTLVDDNGGSITIDGTYDYHGMPVGGKNGWYVVPKDKFTTFANDSAAYGTMGTFDWTKVKYVVADMFTTNLCTVEVGDLKGVKTDNSEVELFNVSKANMFDADADTTYATAALNKNEFFFGPARTHLDKFWNGTYASGGTYTKFKDIACSNGATTTVTMERRWYDADVDYRKDVSVGDLWVKMATAENPTNTDIDLSEYGGIAFNVNAKTASNVKVDTLIRAGGLDYRAYGNKQNVYTVAENGDYKTNKDLNVGGNVFTTGFKGIYYIPFGAFEAGSNEDIKYASAEKLATSTLFFIANSATFANGDAITISNVRAVVDPEATAKIVSVDNSLTHITDTEITAENYSKLKKLFEEATATYTSLSDTNKAKINNAENRFTTIENKFDAYAVDAVQQMIDALPDAINAENYKAAKTALKDAQTAFDGLTAEQKASVNKNKLESTAYIISLYEAGVVQNKINALDDEITKDNYVTAKRNYVSVRNEYEALTDEQKESVTNSVKLDEVKAAIGAFESTKADEIALIDANTGNSGFDLTIGTEAIWKRLGLAGGDQTMDLSFSKGFAFDIETNSDVNAGLTVYFRENGESAKQYGGYGNKTFGMYVYSDGTCKTNSALGIGANLIPAGFKGTIFLPWEAFEKGKEYASAEKAANVKLLLFIDKTFGIGTTLKISNFRLSNGISTSATVLSVDRTFGYIDGTEITDGNYAALNSRFVAAKGNYDALTAENKAKVTNADKIGSIEAKLETYRLGYAIAKIDACLTEVNADNYETAKTLLGEAKKAYGALTDESKERVTNAATIATATAAIETYEASLTDAKLEALPETVNSGNIEEAKLALEEAKAEYDGLDDGVKSKVTKSDKIAALEEKIDVYEAGKVDALIAALTDKIDKDNYKQAKKDYIAAQKAYGNLSANGKTKVANSAKFAAVKAAIEKYENTDPVNVAAIILIAAGAVIAIGGAVTFVLIKSKAKKRG